MGRHVASAACSATAAGRFERYAPADGLPGARVPVIARGVDNGLWIGTDGGLVRFKKPRVTVYTQRDGLASDFVGSIFQDGNGSVWAETGQRIDALRERRLQGPHHERRPPGRSGLAGAAAPIAFPWCTRAPAWLGGRTIASSRPRRSPASRGTASAPSLEDRSGTLWIGIRDGGLMRVRDGHATHLTTKDGLADDSVQALFEDRRGTLWVGTAQKRRDANLGRTA